MPEFKRHPALDRIEGRTAGSDQQPDINSDLKEFERIDRIVDDAARWRSLVSFVQAVLFWIAVGGGVALFLCLF